MILVQIGQVSVLSAFQLGKSYCIYFMLYAYVNFHNILFCIFIIYIVINLYHIYSSAFIPDKSRAFFSVVIVWCKPQKFYFELNFPIKNNEKWISSTSPKITNYISFLEYIYWLFIVSFSEIICYNIKLFNFQRSTVIQYACSIHLLLLLVIF